LTKSQFVVPQSTKPCIGRSRDFPRPVSSYSTRGGTSGNTSRVIRTQYAGYGDNIRLQAADKLVVHHAKAGGIVILEYQVQGTVLATGVPYNNRFVSVITIGDRKIIHWRDYMDSLAAWNALTGPKK
jgi:ketosteroid isomerase-like protein